MQDPASDAFEQAFLSAYPNPERIGCPDDQTLRRLASKELGIEHPARMHIGQCSPCWQAFRRYETQVNEKKFRYRILGSIAATAIVALAGIGIWANHTTTSQHTQGSESLGVLNFSFASERSASGTIKDQVLRRVTRKLIITVPFRDELGMYDVELRKASDNQVILNFSAMVSGERGLKTLRAQVNLALLPAGSYELAWQHKGSPIIEVGEFVLQ